MHTRSERSDFLLADIWSPLIRTLFKKRLYPPFDAAPIKKAFVQTLLWLFTPVHAEGYGKRVGAEPVRSRYWPNAAPFRLRAGDDPIDTVKNSQVHHAALRKAGFPVEMHL
jgi:hypothetical protein